MRSGKLAELCGVSVRTVQYYDSRNLLVPGKFSSGGRRLYSRQDLHKLKIILFLRDLDFSINDIRKILSGKNPEKTISCLISQQESFIRNEISAGQNRLEKLLQVKEGLKDFEKISFDSIGVVAKMIENKKKLKNLHVFMIVVGVLMDIIEIGTAVFWWKTGIWQPFALGMVAPGSILKKRLISVPCAKGFLNPNSGKPFLLPTHPEPGVWCARAATRKVSAWKPIPRNQPRSRKCRTRSGFLVLRDLRDLRDCRLRRGRNLYRVCRSDFAQREPCSVFRESDRGRFGECSRRFHRILRHRYGGTGNDQRCESCVQAMSTN